MKNEKRNRNGELFFKCMGLPEDGADFWNWENEETEMKVRCISP